MPNHKTVRITTAARLTALQAEEEALLSRLSRQVSSRTCKSCGLTLAPNRYETCNFDCAARLRALPPPNSNPGHSNLPLFLRQTIAKMGRKGP